MHVYKKTIITYLSLLPLICTASLKIAPLKEVLQENPHIHYQQCFDKVTFDYEPFQPDLSYPHKGTFDECFILTIPQGRVQSPRGISIINNNTIISEMIWAKQVNSLLPLYQLDNTYIKKAPGKVAVIAQPCFYCYAHWISEVLSRLALLEMHKIEYDWLYIQNNLPFIQETLKLWGINSAKIISPIDDYSCIQADELIIPSLAINTDIGFKHTGLFAHPHTLAYVRNKLINAAQQQNKANFSKKVFISRKDTSRKIINEDEIFKLLKTKGFQRYELSTMSITDQIMLFHNAEIIVAEHGSGLTNIIYCKPHTKIIEIFQALKDASFWYEAHTCNLDYTAIQTIDFAEDYMEGWRSQTNVPLEPIKNIIRNL